MNVLYVMAQSGGQPGGANQIFSMIIPFVLIIVIFYFTMVRPHNQKQKERQKMLDALNKGDDAVTVGGVHGKVMGFKNDNKVVILKVDENVKLEVDVSAVSYVQTSKSGGQS